MKLTSQGATMTAGVLLSLALVACGGSSGKLAATSSTTTTNPPTSTSTTVSTTTSTAPVTIATTTTTVPTTTSNRLGCNAGDLHPSWSGVGNGASGRVYYVINVVNTSGSPCLTGGFFGVSAYGPSGALLASKDSQETALGTGTPTLTVPPGGSVNFSVGFADVNAADGGTSCGIVVSALHLIPPNDTSSDQVATPMQGGGFPSLCGSLIIVGPVRSGSQPSP